MCIRDRAHPPLRQPHWDALPRALAEGQRLRVVSLTAGRVGVRAGMSIPEARACCAALDVRPWDDDAITDAILATTTALLAASPQVTPVAGAPGMWWVGATGFDGLGGEAMLARTLLLIAQTVHPEARVAIADSCVSARAATWAPMASTYARAYGRSTKRATRIDAPRTGRSDGHVAESDPLALPDGVTIIPRGGCATYLAPAPLGLVPMDGELRQSLAALGLRTVGALASLEPGDVERRWGAEGISAWRLSHGEDPRHPGLVRVEAARRASVELPAPADAAAPVVFVMRALLERLVRELIEDGRAAASVAITLVLDAGRVWPLEKEEEEEYPALLHATPSAHAQLLAVPHRTITREIRPARPIARLEPLFDQCRTLLEQWVIPAPVIGVALSIPATAPLAADQGDLLVPSWRDAAMNADAVFTRLRAVLDPDNAGDVVVHPVAGDAHRPEEAGRWARADAMALGATNDAKNRGADNAVEVMRAPVPSSVSAVLRLLDAPEPVEVEEAAGLPDAVWWRGRRLDFRAVDGPERLSGDWWRTDAFARDYWRCAVASEGELLLYRDAAGGMAPRWFVQGWYD